MKIRARITFWFAGILLVSLLHMGAVLRHELIGEYERRRNTESPSEKIADSIFLYGLPTLVVIVAAGSWLISRALRPIEDFTAVAERIHAGNLAERMPLSGRNDELDRLAHVINEMLGRVEAGVASVREFTLHASHELKTPLTILSAESELALSEPDLSEAERQRLESQTEEVRRLAALVDALSMLAKSDAGLPIVSMECFSFDEMTQAGVNAARLLAMRRGISMEIVRCDHAMIHGDRSNLWRALLNVLENAVKHNHEGGWVRVTLCVEGEQLRLSVENTGELISPALLPRVFDRFVRGSESSEGSGLGLSIAKVIVTAHRGTIECFRRDEGGATFVIRLPTAEPKDAEPRRASNSKDGVGDGFDPMIHPIPRRDEFFGH